MRRSILPFKSGAARIDEKLHLHPVRGNLWKNAELGDIHVNLVDLLTSAQCECCTG